jgi:hypothetical protein
VKQLQTSLIAGLEFTYSGEIKAHIVLRKEIALTLIRLAHSQNKTMTEIVTTSLNSYFYSCRDKFLNQQVLI